MTQGAGKDGMALGCVSIRPPSISMKNLISTAALVGVLSAMTGCESGSAPTGSIAGATNDVAAVAPASVARMETTFQTAEPASKGAAQGVVTSLKAGDYAAAGTALKELASNVKLTPEQQAAARELLAQVQDKVKETASQLGEKAGEAAKKAQEAAKKAQEVTSEAVKKARNSAGDAMKDLGEKLKTH